MTIDDAINWCFRRVRWLRLSAAAAYFFFGILVEKKGNKIEMKQPPKNKTGKKILLKKEGNVKKKTRLRSL